MMVKIHNIIFWLTLSVVGTIILEDTVLSSSRFTFILQHRSTSFGKHQQDCVL